MGIDFYLVTVGTNINILYPSVGAVDNYSPKNTICAEWYQLSRETIRLKHEW
jgi:hypothetical protein